MSDQTRPADAAPEDRPGSVRRILVTRVPLWLLISSVLAVAAALLVVVVVQARASVHLGPAAGVARQVEVRLTLCNRDVDKEGINPRTEELALEKVFRDRGARNSNVVVERIDCPPPSSGPASEPS